MAGVHAMMMGGGGGGGAVLYLKPNGGTVAAASEDAKGKWGTLGGKNYYVAVDYDDLVSVVSNYINLTGSGEVLRNLTRNGQTVSIPLNQVVTTFVNSLGTEEEGGLFMGADYFNQLINSWDVSNVTYMVLTFSLCTSYNQPMNYWDTSNCTNMGAMFGWAYSFNQDISSWCVSKIPYKPVMFDDENYAGWTTARQPNWGAAC